VRNYLPEEDDPGPDEYDGYYDIAAKTAKDLAFRFYIKVVRDPERGARLDQQQNETIMNLLRWARQHQDQPSRQAPDLRQSGQEETGPRPS
jgi:hypothetical protein